MTKPYEYQTEGARLIEHKFGDRALLADQMGLGKTFQALLRAKDLIKKGPVIVVCPASLKWNWEREAAHHVGLRAEICEGRKPPKDRIQFSRTRMLIINYDILPFWQKYLKRLKPSLIIGDEIHYIKSRTAKRTKAMRGLCKKVKHVILLSGTPMVNRPAELWPALNIIRPDVFDSFFSFADMFCDPQKTPWGWQFNGAKNLGVLHKLLRKTCMIRRLKKDVLKDLPPKTMSIQLFDLKRRREYDEAERDFIAWMIKNKGRKKASKAARAERLVKIGYLKRLASELKYDMVVEWIKNFLEESAGKIIVFGIHKFLMKDLTEKFKNQSVVVTGNVTGKKRQDRFDQFTHDKRIRILFGNVDAAGVGWNGVAAQTVAFAELPWTPGQVTQGIDRVHRIGQKKKTHCYFLVARNTIESHLCSIIQEKQKVSDATLDGDEINTSLDIFDQLEDLMYRRKRK